MSRNQLIEVRTTQTATHYAMDHHKRGIALIFDHESYIENYAPPRYGTKYDCDNLGKSLERLGFDPDYCRDFTVNQIKSRLKEVSEMDHSAHDCLVIVVLTHGTLGKLYAYDDIYDMDIIFSFFTGDECKSLAGKPKIFFIQACQGNKLNSPIALSEHTRILVTDGPGSKIYRIPTYADFLVAHSTIPGYYSWRISGRGSWFIQSLCSELNDNGTEVDLLTLLTYVARRVAINYETYCPEIPIMHKQKQIPCTTSMLMRVIKFTAPRN